jgi:tetratricopeptide (TPR) repeat protein
VLEKLARERPVVVVLDDIHWAEPTLLDMIEYVAGFASGPILLACTARPDLFDTRPHWAQTDTIELRALADSDANDLIDALLGQSGISRAMHEQITERAEGNPLFVEQMVALAGENGAEEIAVPATIQALLEARLDRLDSPERAILVRGAVEGRLFHRGAVSALLPEEDRDAVTGRLLGLARKEFVRPDAALFPGDDAFRFVHILVRDAAYEAAPRELRADLHERFARWIEARADDRLPELEEIVGYHLELSFRHRQALGLLDDDARNVATSAGERLATAGERAVRRGDHRAAANLLERAYALLPAGERRLELVSPLALALYEAGRVEDAQRLHNEAIAEAQDAGLVRLALRSEIARNQVRLGTDPSWSAQEARALAERAIPVFEAAGDDRGLFQAFELLHDVEWMRGGLEAAVSAGELAVAAAERVGDVNLVARMREGVSAARWFGGSPMSEMKPEVEESVEWARAVGHRAMEANSMFALGWAAIEQQDFEEGRRLCEEGITQLDELGLVVHAAGQRSHFRWGEMIRDSEGVDRRMRIAYETLKAAGETGFLSTVAAHRAMLLARRGDLDEAVALADESESLGSVDDVTTQVGLRTARAMIFVRRGDFVGAEVLAREALDRALAKEYVELTASGHLALADVLNLAGRPQEAGAEMEKALAIFEAKEMADSANAVRAQLAELQSSGSPSQ